MDIVFATSNSLVTTPDGGRHAVVGGQHWPADDPVVRAAPAGLFTADPMVGLAYSAAPVVEPPVETLTAGPGERRGRVNRG